MNTSRPAVFFWNPQTAPVSVATAIRTLAHRFGHRLSETPSARAAEIRFELQPAAKGMDCAAAYDAAARVWTIRASGTVPALRTLGLLVSGAIQSSSFAEHTPFSALSLMVDCSRNAVPTIAYFREFLNSLALLGFNTVLLYTEDMYKVEGEPCFGAMRGAYSGEEIRAFDDHAAALGIELAPSVQTLGHMEQLSRWPRFQPVLDNPSTLLANEEQTYELLDRMIAFWRRNVRSRRMHINMDEARAAGKGQYLKKFGERPQLDILLDHLARVAALCRKHEFTPMMASDLIFTFSSEKHIHYDPACTISPAIARRIPEGTGLVYWDYYHTEPSFYQGMIRKHLDLTPHVTASGGIWSWFRFWYDHGYTEGTLFPMLQAAVAEEVPEFLATIWGDDGAYCDYDSTFTGLAWNAAFAFCPPGATPRESVIEQQINGLFGGKVYGPGLALARLSYMNFPMALFDDPLMLMYLGTQRVAPENPAEGRAPGFTFHGMLAALGEARQALAAAPAKSYAGDFVFARSLAAAVETKMRLAEGMIGAWQGDAAARPAAFRGLLPLAAEYLKHLTAFDRAFRTMWHRHNKPFGLEPTQIRLAGQRARTEELIRRIRAFADNQPGSGFPELDDLLAVRDGLDMTFPSYKRIAFANVST